MSDLATTYANEHSAPDVIAREFDRSRRASLDRHHDHTRRRRQRVRLVKDFFYVVAGAVAVYVFIIILSVGFGG